MDATQNRIAVYHRSTWHIIIEKANNIKSLANSIDMLNKHHDPSSKSSRAINSYLLHKINYYR